MSPKPDARRYYDAFADSGFYDRDAEASDWPAKADALVARAFEAKPPGTVQSVLDLGAGTGISIDAIQKHARPEHIVAVDASSRMLALLRQKHSEPTVKVETDTIQSYVETCQETFDLITSLSVMEFLPNLPFTLGQTAKLLNGDGLLAVTYVPQAEGEPPEEFLDSTSAIGAAVMTYRWPPAEIEQSLADNGLAIVDRVDAVTAQESKGLEYNFIVARKPAT